MFKFTFEEVDYVWVLRGDLSDDECLLLPNTCLLKFWKAIMTTVTLSRDCLYREFLRMLSTARPDC